MEGDRGGGGHRDCYHKPEEHIKIICTMYCMYSTCGLKLQYMNCSVVPYSGFCQRMEIRTIVNVCGLIIGAYTGTAKNKSRLYLGPRNNSTRG